MKLTKFILSVISAVAFSSCSAVYETDNICSQGADVRLSFRNNLQGTDLFSSDVHCPKLFLYDRDGRFFGDFTPPSDGRINIDLPLGEYVAIAYGGMTCEEADIEFSETPRPGSHYTDLTTRLKDTRAAESHSSLHPHFHGLTRFAITMEDMDYVPVAIDLTKNTNRFRICLRYSDGSAISPDGFSFSIAADNAVADYENKVVEQGEEISYNPCDAGIADGAAWADISLPRLMANGEARLLVKEKERLQPVVDIELLQYLAQTKELDMKGSTLQDYLDRCDSWTLEFILNPDTDRLDALTFTINKWTMVINAFDL